MVPIFEEVEMEMMTYLSKLERLRIFDKKLIFGIVCNVAKTLGIGTDME